LGVDLLFDTAHQSSQSSALYSVSFIFWISLSTVSVNYQI